MEKRLGKRGDMDGSIQTGSAGRQSRARVAIAIALGVSFLLVGAALATPGFNVISAPIHARGTTDGRINVSSEAGIKLKTRRSIDVATQQIVIGPGGHTGWHSHPGPVLVTVKSGALRVIYANDCTGRGTVYDAGDTFVDRGDETVHIARNESSTANVEIWATYLVPGAPGTGVRIDEADPGPPGSCDDDEDDDDD
jgi:quercetin dioxygenase-like cupin family protein